MNENLMRIRLLSIAAVFVTTCALSAAEADLQRVIACLEKREKSQDPVWYEYTLKTYMSANFRKIAGKVKKIPEHDMRDVEDLRFENTVEYAKKGPIAFQKVTGPMAQGKLFALIDRPQPSIFASDGQRILSYDSPQHVRVSAQAREQIMLPTSRPSDISGEQMLLLDLKSTAAGEVYDLTAFKDDELVDGGRLCRIELRAKKSKWRSRIYLYPRHSYAIKSWEVTSPELGTVWKIHDCAYQQVDGVAYLQKGIHTAYGGKRDARILVKEIIYEAQTIETNIRKFPNLRSEVNIAADARYNDIDMQKFTSDPQIQGVLDALAGLSKKSND